MRASGIRIRTGIKIRLTIRKGIKVLIAILIQIRYIMMMV